MISSYWSSTCNSEGLKSIEGVINSNRMYWLGGRSVAGEGQERIWYWTDGTSLKYTNWNTGQPNSIMFYNMIAWFLTPPVLKSMLLVKFSMGKTTKTMSIV